MECVHESRSKGACDIVRPKGEAVAHQTHPDNRVHAFVDLLRGRDVVAEEGGVLFSR